MSETTTTTMTSAVTAPPTYKPGERSIVDIIKDLSKPVAARHIQQKRQGGTSIDFISWYHRVKYLDLYAPGWTNEILEIVSIAGKLIIRVRLGIPTSEGMVWREATGQEEEDKEGYGDSTSNAEAMAFSRASAKFGLGLSLYEKKK
jgi:hypothetical protein